MSLAQYLSLPLSAMLLLSPAATRSLLAEAPPEQQLGMQDARLEDVLTPHTPELFAKPARMSIQTFTPPAYQYRPLPDQPNTTEFWQQVGQNAVIAQDYANAVVAFDKALELAESRTAEIYARRGWAHYLHQQQNEAIADLQLAASMYLSRQDYDDYVNARRMIGFVARQEEVAGNAVESVVEPALEAMTGVENRAAIPSTDS